MKVWQFQFESAEPTLKAWSGYNPGTGETRDRGQMPGIHCPASVAKPLSVKFSEGLGLKQRWRVAKRWIATTGLHMHTYVCVPSPKHIYTYAQHTHKHARTHTHMHWLNQNPWSRGLGSGFAKFRKWTHVHQMSQKHWLTWKAEATSEGAQEAGNVSSSCHRGELSFTVIPTYCQPRGLAVPWSLPHSPPLSLNPTVFAIRCSFHGMHGPGFAFRPLTHSLLDMPLKQTHTRTLPCEPVRRFLGRWSKIILHDLHGRYVWSHFVFSFWYYSLFPLPFLCGALCITRVHRKSCQQFLQLCSLTTVTVIILLCQNM